MHWLRRLFCSPVELGFLLIPLACSFLFEEAFVASKWVVFYGLVGVAVLQQRKWEVPSFPRVIGIPMLIILAGVAIHGVTHPQSFSSRFLVDWLSFLFLVLIFQYKELGRKFWEKAETYNLLATLSILTIAGLQLVEVSVFGLVADGRDISSLFGHPNIAGEFIGVSLLLQVYGIASGDFFNKKGVLFLRGALFTISLSYLYMLSGRASMVAFLGGLFIWRKALWYHRKVYLGILLGALLSLFLLLQVQAKMGGRHLFGDKISTDKAGGIELRLAKWANTLPMILENPLGIGVDRFQYEYLNYKKREIYDREVIEEKLIRSPHNGYLEILSEYGVIIGMGVMGLILSLLLERRRLAQRMEKPYLETPLVDSLFFFLLIDAFFAFPLELPYTFFVAAVVGGTLLREVSQRGWFYEGASAHWVFIALLVFFGWRGMYPLYRYAQNPNDKEGLEQICDVHSSDWKPCIQLGRLYVNAGDYERGEKLFSQVLQRESMHPVALNSLIIAKIRQLKKREACVLIHQYNEWINEPHSFTELYNKKCQAILSKEE